MNFKALSFAPYMCKYALDLVERRSFAVIVADDEIFMQVCSKLEHLIWNAHSWSSRCRDSDWSKPLKRFIFRCSNSLHQQRGRRSLTGRVSDGGIRVSRGRVSWGL